MFCDNSVIATLQDMDHCPLVQPQLKSKIISRNNSSHQALDEQRRLEEGADALLNLAGIATTRDPYYTSSSCSSAQSTPLKRTHSDIELHYPNGFTNGDSHHLHSQQTVAAAASSYYSSAAANQTYMTHSYSTPPKKHKSRMMKQKLKRKASWLR